MNSKKILLVGGCGFIGHNLALHLKKIGNNPTIVDSLEINNLYAKPDNEITNKHLYDSILNNRLQLLKEKKIDCIIKDVKDLKNVEEIYKEINPDVIIHLAAVSHANKSNKDPHTTFENSFRTLESTLEFAKSKKIHVIYLSSSMVYGNFESAEVDENSPCNPIGIYGNLKLSGEMILKSYNQIFDLPYTIIRPSALYGERCVSRRVGQIFIENAIQNLKIKINGDGNDKLDFTYIEDLIEGIAICCHNKKALNQTFNITYGNARKINDLLEILKKEFPHTKIEYTERDKLMPKRGTLSVNKAKNLLDFIPKVPIDTGYLKYISWYRNFWEKIN